MVEFDKSKVQIGVGLLVFIYFGTNWVTKSKDMRKDMPFYNEVKQRNRNMYDEPDEITDLDDNLSNLIESLRENVVKIKKKKRVVRLEEDKLRYQLKSIKKIFNKFDEIESSSEDN